MKAGRAVLTVAERDRHLEALASWLIGTCPTDADAIAVLALGLMMFLEGVAVEDRAPAVERLYAALNAAVEAIEVEAIHTEAERWPLPVH